VQLLFAWRKAYRRGRLDAEAPPFYPVRVDEDGAHAGDGRVPPEPPENRSASPVEIVLRNGRRMMVRSDITPEALERLLDVVDR
jgi:transposase